MKISVLVLDGVFDSGLAAILDVLQAANELRGELPQPPPAWEVALIRADDAPVHTAAGHTVNAVDLATAPAPELLVLPGVGHKRPAPLLAWLDSPERQPTLDLLARARADGVPLAAACTGSFLLAESGLLDGLPATTSWWLAPAFRHRYPQVALDENRMVTHAAGITTAGAALAHLDLALALVRERSPLLADLTARYLVVDSRPGQASYAIPGHLARNDPTVAAFERWVREHLDRPLRIADAARAVGTSERTLQRALDRVLGIPPLRFAQRVRLEQAAHLLRTTDLPTDVVARRVGYENATTLSTLLRERLGTTPGRLRRAPGP
ncbi:helix-turn-helix domain-containing protein [Kitasatospora sp. NBC_01287]|uniref:GlxA family transcriptional regulator n=1 Tax=Kitasatospora sp. NBC_01287 TaxID=2903573 RepID=UPI0022517555|nr:helix-turn-helix domain-containing protein [Kitasatospora sp. NBC_01287]MCX4747744.1 helix-turn-helix domain-containing protein [Kitasatospora sp. NBC_01287]